MSERLRAVLTTHKPKFLQKCIQTNVKLFDCYSDKIYTNIAVFVPKLTPQYIEPVVMVNVSNGRSSCLMRLSSPFKLKKALQQIINVMETDLFVERWERINDVSDNIVDSGLPLVYDKLYYNPNK